MSWNYQACRHTVSLPKGGTEDVFDVREVYPGYGDHGETLWTEEAMDPYGETKAELVRCLRMMLADVQHFDVLDLDEMEKSL